VSDGSKTSKWAALRCGSTEASVVVAARRLFIFLRIFFMP
jgi:hypothetical protein